MSDAWTIAARFASPGEAAAARTALDAAGIETYLADQNLASIDWLYTQAIGSFKLMVRPEDLDSAREIIGGAAASPGPEKPSAEPDVPAEAAKCPYCDSERLERIPRFRLFLLLAAVFIGLGVAVGQTMLAMIALLAVTAGVLMMPSHRCAACGERSTSPPQERWDGPDAPDMIDEPCPRCGSLEVYRIDHRRLKAIPLLFNPAIFAVVPIWLFLPKRRCESCGLKLR